MAAVRHLGFVMRICTSRKEYLMVFSVVQNVVGVNSSFYI